MRRSTRACDREEGAAAVEFALVFPILVLLLLGIIQFGIVFYQWLEIEHAAREGARWASMRDAGSYGSQLAATKAVVKDAAPGVTLTDDDITVVPANPTIEDFKLPVTVTVSYDAPIVAPWMGEFFGVTGTTFTLKASATQRIE